MFYTDHQGHGWIRADAAAWMSHTNRVVAAHKAARIFGRLRTTRRLQSLLQRFDPAITDSGVDAFAAVMA